MDTRYRPGLQSSKAPVSTVQSPESRVQCIEPIWFQMCKSCLEMLEWHHYKHTLERSSLEIVCSSLPRDIHFIKCHLQTRIKVPTYSTLQHSTHSTRHSTEPESHSNHCEALRPTVSIKSTEYSHSRTPEMTSCKRLGKSKIEDRNAIHEKRDWKKLQSYNRRSSQ